MMMPNIQHIGQQPLDMSKELSSVTQAYQDNTFLSQGDHPTDGPDSSYYAAIQAPLSANVQDKAKIGSFQQYRSIN